METRANLIKIGIFVLAVILAGFAGAFWLLKGDQKGPRTTVAVNFQGSVGGLLTGAAVAYNGIKVGEVTNVQFATNDPAHVMVTLAVDSNAPIPKDAVVGLGFSGLTGYATVQITGGDPKGPRLLDEKGGVPMLSADTSAVQDLMGGARKLMGEADTTLTTVQQLVSQGAPQVQQVLKNTATFSDALAKNSDNISRFMDSLGKAADVLTKVADRVEKLSDDVDGLVTTVDKEKIAKIVSNAATISDDLAKSSGSLSGLVGDARTVVSGLKDLSANVGAGVTDARMIIAAVDPAKVSSAIDDVSKATHYLTTKTGDLDDIISHVKATSASVDAFTQDLKVKSPEVAKIIDDAASTMQQIEVASHRLDGILGKADGLVGSDGGQSLFQAGRAFLAEATDAASSFKELSRTLKQVSTQGLHEVKDFVADTHKTLGTIDKAVNDIDLDPQRFIFGPKQLPSPDAKK